MAVLKKLGFIFDKRQKGKVLILLIAIWIGSAFELLGVTAILPLINVMMTPELVTEKAYFRAVYELFGFHSVASFIVFLCLVITVIYILKNLYLVALGDVQFRFVFNNQRRLSYRIMDIYMKQPYLFHTMHNTSELDRNVSGDTQVFFRAVLAMLQLITDTSVCIILFIFLLATDFSMTIVLALLFAVFLLLYMKVFKKRLKLLGEKNREYNADMKKWILQAFGGIKEIQLLNREEFFVSSYDRVYRKYADSQRKYNVMGIIPKPIMETLCIAGLVGIIAVRVSGGVNMEEFIPVISTFAVAAFKMLPSFNKITANLGIVIFSKPAIDAVYEDLQRVSRLEEERYEKYKSKESFEFKRQIQVERLGFQYPEGPARVIDKVSLTIPKNKSVAFIGPSGAGKTTLADIILGVLKPTEGAVLVDGVNVHENLYSWHNKIGYIPQFIYLTDDTLRNNIAFGIHEDEIEEAKVWEALESAQLKEFVESLPMGLDTFVGESGVRLSGGQRQRIGIARALYHNPQVLVLDEATSALDNETEKAVMEAIDRLAGSKTLIIIAHRLSTIEKCDYVYEVKDKKVLLKQEKQRQVTK